MERLWPLALALLACGGTPEPAARARGHELGSAVARIDQETISLAELQSFCRATGSSPRAALDRLIGERLLASYAAKRGYDALPSVRRGIEQARVRTLLAREVEGPGSPEGVAQRRDKLDRWLVSLAQAAHVTYDEAAIQKAFAQEQP